jgi:hypothetical protein
MFKFILNSIKQYTRYTLIRVDINQNVGVSSLTVSEIFECLGLQFI